MDMAKARKTQKFGLMANKELQIFEWLIRNHNSFWMANREFALLYSDV
jgi:hypothetical protein